MFGALEFGVWKCSVHIVVCYSRFKILLQRPQHSVSLSRLLMQNAAELHSYELKFLPFFLQSHMVSDNKRWSTAIVLYIYIKADVIAVVCATITEAAGAGCVSGVTDSGNVRNNTVSRGAPSH